ncbi:YjbF family lipoprotein [Klebsiella michiganensis]|uniref:YjbF family lipoprotein n=1 Tax=Klebsiella michiganensis TaxID=1134687 RepID=UPI003F50106B
MRYLLFLLSLCCLQACTPSWRSVGETFKQTLSGQDDAVISGTQLNRLPAPLGGIYLRLQQVPRLFVAGYHQDGQDYWVTRDQVVFVTRNGRLVKTVGYRDNLLSVSDQQQDPLSRAKMLHEGAVWTRTVRWTENGNPLSSVVTSHFHQQGTALLNLAGTLSTCQVWVEEVSQQAADRHWQNVFWIDAISGQVRQSRQYLGPGLPVEITLLKNTQIS